MSRYLAIGFGIIIALGAALSLGSTGSPLLQRSSVCKTTLELKQSCTDYDVIDGTTLGAAAAARTVTVHTDGMAKLRTTIILTDTNDDCATMTATCTCSLDLGTRYGSLTTRSITSGASTVHPMVDTIARATAEAGVVLEYGIEGCSHVSCVYAGIAACAEDTLIVQWALAVGR